MAGILATLVSAAVAAYIRVSFLPVGVTLGDPEPFFGTWWQIIQVFTYNPIVVFSTTTLFITGGLIGDRIERRAAESGGYQVPT